MKEKRTTLSSIIVTGLSGAGKSSALRVLEDLNYFTVDNLPIPFIFDFFKLIRQKEDIEKVALGIDVREYIFHEDLSTVIKNIKAQEAISIKVLFLECSEEVIVRRYSETRRPHPLARNSSILEGIKKERELLSSLREIADYIIDTSGFNVHDLRRNLVEKFGFDSQQPSLQIQILSFGYKYGIPFDADLLFDVRFLPNPYFNKELRKKTGLDEEIREYLNKFEETKIFIERLVELLMFLLPLYEREGKSYLTIGIGCTGGQHRSVAIAEDIAKILGTKWRLKVLHRDSKYWKGEE